MEDFLNKWIFYPWLKNSNLDELIHPDDLNKISGIGVVYCFDLSDGYLVVKDKSDFYRVKLEGVARVLPSPEFVWNEIVCDKSKPDIKAQIDDFFWHHKKGKFLYYIKVNGKRKSKQFESEELEKI